MYLEISPRGANKTWRLTKQLQFEKDTFPNKNFYIVSYCRRNSLTILNNINGSISNVFILDEKNQIPIDGKVFYDEFDFIGGLEKINENGYYSTTAYRQRSVEDLHNKESQDILIKLIQANNYSYQSYLPSLVTDSFYKELKENLSSEQFDLEILNKFII